MLCCVFRLQFLELVKQGPSKQHEALMYARKFERFAESHRKGSNKINFSVKPTIFECICTCIFDAKGNCSKFNVYELTEFKFSFKLKCYAVAVMDTSMSLCSCNIMCCSQLKINFFTLRPGCSVKILLFFFVVILEKGISFFGALRNVIPDLLLLC